MSKEVQVSIKVESDLRGRFMAVAADRHRTAAQIIRDLMRLPSYTGQCKGDAKLAKSAATTWASCVT